MSRFALAALVLGLTLTVVAPAFAASRPLILGHRGAAGERPEHTEASYELAIAEGADFIEPDLVLTKDGVLIARHENEIGATTDVASHPEFADRKTSKTIDGQVVTGWFTEDFTLAEIKTLRARERLPQLRPGNALFDGQFPVLTFEEVIDLARREGKARGRMVGVYAELKHPTYFASIGLPMEDRFVAVLKAKGLAGRASPFFFECFELGSLKKVKAQIPVRTIFLVDDSGAPADLVAASDPRTYADLIKPDALKTLSSYVDGIGPAKALIVPRDKDGRSSPPTTLIADAHAAHLLVHPWTFRAENNFLPTELRRGDPASADYLAQHGDVESEIRQFYKLGVDGLFADFPDIAFAVRGRR